MQLGYSGDGAAVLTVNMLDFADSAFAVDVNRRVIVWNAAAEALLGVPSCEALGLPCSELMSALGVPCCRYCPRSPDACTTERALSLHTDEGFMPRRASASSGIVMTSFLAHTSDRGVRIIHLLLPAPPHPPALACASCSQPEVTACSPSHPLTPREREILCMLASGCAAHQIADELTISYVTVRNHIAHIMAKLGAHTQLQVVAAASREDLLNR